MTISAWFRAHSDPQKGSAGGHNGIKNIIAHLGTQEFPRVRIGVGEKPARMDLADYVLGNFPKEEAETMTTRLRTVRRQSWI